MVEIEEGNTALARAEAVAGWTSKPQVVDVDRGNLRLEFHDVQRASSSYGIDHKRFQGQQVQDPTFRRIYHLCTDQVDHIACTSSAPGH